MLVIYLACVAHTCCVFTSLSNHKKKPKKKAPQMASRQPKYPIVVRDIIKPLSQCYQGVVADVGVSSKRKMKGKQ